MFTLASGFYENYLIPPEVSLLVIGLDNAGKTTLLERLKVTDFKSQMQVRSGKRISVKPVVSKDVKDGKKEQKNKNGKDSAELQQQNGVNGQLNDQNGGANQSGNNSIEHNDRHRHSGNGTQSKKTNNGTSNGSSFNHKEDSRIQNNHSNDTTNSSKNMNTSMSKRFGCPAPRSYRESANNTNGTHDDDGADFVYEGNGHGNDDCGDDECRNIYKFHQDSERSLSSTCSEAGIVPLPTSNIPSKPITAPHETAIVSKKTSKKKKAKQTRKQSQYDQKPNSKMFPIHLIRPTVGMNLAKFDACNAKVRLMDLGGSTKMRNLWERYYKGIHGVAFVVDVSQHASVAKLMEARAFYRCMLDDEMLRNVPILIFANKIDEREDRDDNQDENENGKSNSDQEKDATSSNNGNVDMKEAAVGTGAIDGGALGDTSLLDIAELFLSPPRGSPTSNFNFKNVAMFAGSAKSGEGVRPAFEWLIRMGAFLVKAQRRASM